MCGIAGILSSNQSLVTEEKVRKMTASIAHRGPDGDGHWMNTNNTVAFGHRRLAIIDLSNAGAQPMHFAGRYTIVYNGEIYNYIELKETLQSLGYRFASQTDTEVILAAYDHWKEDCLQEFDGMFSFALWDEKEQLLFAARDRFGEKPFYYYEEGGQFVFASEMKALWSIGIEKRPDEKMLLNYLAIGHVQNANDKDETFFREIYSLPPASYLFYRLSDTRSQVHSYWDLDKENIVRITEKEAVEKFTELFRTSIQRRLRSDVPVGTSLSGGLDSSSIVSVLQEVSNKKTYKAFSAVFPGFERDESVYMKKMVDRFGLEHYITNPTAEGMVAEFEKLCFHQEEPFSSSSIFAQYKVYELARKEGVTVLLDGQGADETMAGYHKYIHWFLQQLVNRGRLASLSREKRIFREHNSPFNWGLKNYFAAFFPAHVNVKLESIQYQRILRQPDIHSNLKAATRGREWEGLHKPIITKLNDILYYNTRVSGLEELLRYADRNSMAHGREVRLPYLNHELVQFLFSLPANYKMHDGFSKWVLRKAMDGHLPDEIVWRTDKVGFEPPQRKWMNEPLMQEYIHEAKRKLVNAQVLQPSVLDRKVRPMDAHEADNYDWRYLTAATTLL